jgi:putative addiction module killer protein
MNGCPGWLTRRQRLESWLDFVARRSENFGDCESVGEGVSEMRVHFGAGYRVYYTRTGSTVYILLAGGVKASQAKDIAKAKQLARELKRVKS